MFGRKRKFKGYMVDSTKEENMDSINNYYIPSSSRKKSTLLRHGELLSEQDVKKLNVSTFVKKKYLVPVSVGKEAVVKCKRGAGSRTTKEVNYFLEKPEIRGNYMPNRLNANNYKKKS